jgi:hypothetical protein
VLLDRWISGDFSGGHRSAPQVFFQHEAQNSGFHLALTLAVLPRLIAVIAVMTCTFVLLRTNEWVWVERLRLALLVAAIIALISLALDAEFFPGRRFETELVGSRLRSGRCTFLFLSAAFFKPTIGRQNAEL